MCNSCSKMLDLMEFGALIGQNMPMFVQEKQKARASARAFFNQSGTLVLPGSLFLFSFRLFPGLDLRLVRAHDDFSVRPNGPAPIAIEPSHAVGTDNPVSAGCKFLDSHAVAHL